LEIILDLSFGFPINNIISLGVCAWVNVHAFEATEGVYIFCCCFYRLVRMTPGESELTADAVVTGEV